MMHEDGVRLSKTGAWYPVPFRVYSRGVIIFISSLYIVQGAPHDYLMREVTVTEPGYAYIFFSNENLTQVDVHFDDVKITHTHSNIVAGADYYPFGLAMDGSEIDDEPYRWGYQGQYAEKDTTTRWNEFELRMYDPRIGRWLSPDPYGQYASPYLAMGNMPHMSVDPDGGFVPDPILLQAVTVSTMSYATIASIASSLLSSAATFAMLSAGCCPDPPGYTDRRGFNSNLYIGPEESPRALPDFPTELPKPDANYQAYLNRHSISAVKPTVWSSMAQSSNLLASTAYGFINGVNLGSYFLTPWRGEARNLDGSFATSRERVLGFTSTAASFIPVSRLNSLRSSAVRQAWKQEADLVRRTGQGTVDWSTSQMNELLATGRVDGYVGHHINSVKMFPHLAGVADNIMFVLKKFHFKLHRGNWRNPTSGELLKRK